MAPRGARIYENCNLITVIDADPIETKVAAVADDVADAELAESPEDDVADAKVAELPEDDVADLDDVDFSLGGELTIDLVVGIELCQDAVENT